MGGWTGSRAAGLRFLGPELLLCWGLAVLEARLSGLTVPGAALFLPRTGACLHWGRKSGASPSWRCRFRRKTRRSWLSRRRGRP